MDDLISIIIVNYNTEALLDKCIQSVYEKTAGITFEIIVVDNNSKEGSLDNLIQKYPQVRFHLSSENMGFGRANNVGVNIAKGNYLFLLNPDTVLINNAIGILHNYIKQHPETGVCGGNLYKEDMTPNGSFHSLDLLSYEYRILLNKKLTFGFNYTDRPQEVNIIMGADIFMPKALFIEQKGFDPDFFMYFEEVELCDRIRKAGYKIISVPQAKIIHLQGAAAEKQGNELSKWSYAEHWYSKLIYFQKTKGKFRTSLIYNLQMLKADVGLAVSKVRGNGQNARYWSDKTKVMKDAYTRYQTYLKTKMAD